MEQRNNVFHYSYSAKQQEEIKKIRQQYAPPKEDKMEQLRRLDESAKKPGTIAGIVVGTISALIMGLGMTCTMVWTNLFIPGIIIGLIGIAGVASAYPLYTGMTKKRRKKIAPEILRLSDELMEQA
ncbi:MAG: hypothetical protein ACK5LX_06965 [Oscillospiraceae bacterium]